MGIDHAAAEHDMLGACEVNSPQIIGPSGRVQHPDKRRAERPRASPHATARSAFLRSRDGGKLIHPVERRAAPDLPLRRERRALGDRADAQRGARYQRLNWNAGRAIRTRIMPGITKRIRSSMDRGRNATDCCEGATLRSQVASLLPRKP